MVDLAGDGVEFLQHGQLQEDTAEIELIEWIVGHVEDFLAEEKSSVDDRRTIEHTYAD